MNRRGFLRGAGVAGGIALSGCLGRLGFEEESAWRDPPLVENRPAAVYMPASTEEMGVYGSSSDSEYAVELSYTFPHRFWTVAGSDTNRVTVGPDDTHHLMCTVWDPETDTVLPVDVSLELLQDDAVVASPNLWSMLSQRMGFHYGENVILPDEGTYTARVRVGPLEATPTGDLEGRFDTASTLEIDFEYQRSDIHDLEFELVDRDLRGTQDALELMDHSEHHGDHGDGEGDHDTHGDGDDGEHEANDHEALGHPPTARGVSIDELEGRVLGTERSADANISVLETDLERFTGDEEAYLAVFTRTPYNDVILPLMSLTASLERGGDTLLEASLTETLDHEFGHHYGLAVEELEEGDRVTVSVDGLPQIARHDGYETAFFEFEDVVFDV